jgi:hypothetical protein
MHAPGDRFRSEVAEVAAGRHRGTVAVDRAVPRSEPGHAESETEESCASTP